MLLELIGFFGAILLAISGVPQAIKSYNDKHSDGMAHGLIILWLTGEFLMLIYTLIQYSNDFTLLLNYSTNFAIVSIIAYYKYYKCFGKFVKYVRSKLYP
jgi:uncharacterized protein with PQ loop repeat